MKLYELTREYEETLSILSEMDNIDFETIENTLSPIKSSLTDKYKNVASYINNVESELESLKEHKNNIDSRIKKHQKKINWMREYLKINMERADIKSIKCPFFSISIRDCQPRLVVEDELMLPSEYIKTVIETKVDNESLKRDLKNGMVCPGAYLQHGKSLTIKVD